MPTDPVCGMSVDESTPYKVEQDDEVYYFCSRECAQEFVENPDEYVGVWQESYGE